MNETVSDTATIEALQTIENVIWQVEEDTIAEHGKGMIADLLAFNDGRTEAQILVALVGKGRSTFDTLNWLIGGEALSQQYGNEVIRVQDDNDGGDDGDFGYLLFGPDLETLNAAGRRFMELLQQQEGLFDVSSTMTPSVEIMSLLPVAYDLGLNLSNIANQVGASFWQRSTKSIAQRWRSSSDG